MIADDIPRGHFYGLTQAMAGKHKGQTLVRGWVWEWKYSVPTPLRLGSAECAGGKR
jgi:hypothetical protein